MLNIHVLKMICVLTASFKTCFLFKLVVWDGINSVVQLIRLYICFTWISVLIIARPRHAVNLPMTSSVTQGQANTVSSLQSCEILKRSIVTS